MRVTLCVQDFSLLAKAIKALSTLLEASAHLNGLLLVPTATAPSKPIKFTRSKKFYISATSYRIRVMN